MTNPYTERILGLLGDADPQETLAASPGRLERVVSQLSDQRLDRSYAPGKWTARQILAHLTDIELAVGFRLRQALAEDDHTIQPLDQDRWLQRSSTLDLAQALRTFKELRRWNLALIHTLSEGDLARPAMHPERGPEPVGGIIRMLAGHDLNHLPQLEHIATSSE
jgi:hypothetical protein